MVDIIEKIEGDSLEQKMQRMKKARYFLSATFARRGREFQAQLSHPAVPWIRIE